MFVRAVKILCISALASTLFLGSPAFADTAAQVVARWGDKIDRIANEKPRDLRQIFGTAADVIDGMGKVPCLDGKDSLAAANAFVKVLNDREQKHHLKIRNDFLIQCRAGKMHLDFVITAAVNQGFEPPVRDPAADRAVADIFTKWSAKVVAIVGAKPSDLEEQIRKTSTEVLQSLDKVPCSDDKWAHETTKVPEKAVAELEKTTRMKIRYHYGANCDAKQKISADFGIEAAVKQDGNTSAVNKDPAAADRAVAEAFAKWADKVEQIAGRKPNDLADQIYKLSDGVRDDLKKIACTDEAWAHRTSDAVMHAVSGVEGKTHLKLRYFYRPRCDTNKLLSSGFGLESPIEFSSK
jgi:hypothetical protein